MSASFRPVVVVPVYNAVAELKACLGALARTLRSDDDVLLADDASPDPSVPAMLDRVCAAMPLRIRRVRRERNLGFVGNVNAALRETGDRDVVLLNSDTVPAPGWLDAIVDCAARDPSIATITPWSNNAEICSFPEFLRINPLPDDARLQTLAAACAAEPLDDVPELPTGVGFCMYLRRAAVRRLGDFDAATFGRGYGEENDWCRRAARHGWRNVFCPRAFVAHRGSASFAAEGLHPGGENLARLVARYPDYNALIADFIRRDPLLPLRERLAARLAAASPASLPT